MNCSSCGGVLRYDIARCGLICDHCGTIRPLHRPEEGAVVGDMDFASAVRTANANWGVSRRLVICKSCGAQMLYDSDQMSGLCPFCGSAIVLSPEEANCGIAPNAIIPFSITKEQVAGRFYRWNKFAFWSPEKFRKGKVLGNLTPVYIPYWTFDADTVTTYRGKFAYTTGSGDNEKTVCRVKEGIVEKHIDDCCVCGSRKFSNDRMLNSVISFRASELIPYQPEILSGMAAEIYTVGIDEAWSIAKSAGMRDKIRSAAIANEYASGCSEFMFSTEYYNVRFRYVLIPVWLTGCMYGGKVYNVVASGHNGTGKCSRPFSVFKLISFLVIMAALFTLSVIFNFSQWFLTAVFAGFFLFLIIYVGLFTSALSEQRRFDRQGSERG